MAVDPAPTAPAASDNELTSQSPAPSVRTAREAFCIPCSRSTYPFEARRNPASEFPASDITEWNAPENSPAAAGPAPASERNWTVEAWRDAAAPTSCGVAGAPGFDEKCGRRIDSATLLAKEEEMGRYISSSMASTIMLSSFSLFTLVASPSSVFSSSQRRISSIRPFSLSNVSSTSSYHPSKKAANEPATSAGSTPTGIVGL
mmetsp:Transcript_30814/g.61003  ORF Transcript_30814/g.61003 Transcript_30814/m.61003 type:complete len:203 (+) Transcript_30814:1383-1991(+)